MADLSSLAEHYSALAFKTRIYALTFTGAVLGADFWVRGSGNELTGGFLTPRALLGLLLLAVVGSLGELNRRYTSSYVAACRSMGGAAPGWREFVRLNEKRYSFRENDRLAEKAKKLGNRFVLSWLTYIPGWLLGVALLLGENQLLPSAIGILGALIMMAWWCFAAWQESTAHLSEKPKLRKR